VCASSKQLTSPAGDAGIIIGGIKVMHRIRKDPFGQHLHQISQAQFESEIPAHVQDNHVALEVTTCE
jgi:hypothetical protein